MTIFVYLELRKELATSRGKKKEMLLRTWGIDYNQSDNSTQAKSQVNGFLEAQLLCNYGMSVTYFLVTFFY